MSFMNTIFPFAYGCSINDSYIRNVSLLTSYGNRLDCTLSTVKRPTDSYDRFVENKATRRLVLAIRFLFLVRVVSNCYIPSVSNTFLFRLARPHPAVSRIVLYLCTRCSHRSYRRRFLQGDMYTTVCFLALYPRTLVDQPNFSIASNSGLCLFWSVYRPSIP